MKRALIVLIILLAALVVDAHGQTPTVPVGQAFTLAWDQPAPIPGQVIQTGYRIELNGNQVGSDISDASTRQTSVAGIATCGSNSIRVASLAPGAAPSWSAPLSFTVGNCPGPMPNNLRIIIGMARQPDGTWKLAVTAVEVEEE